MGCMALLMLGIQPLALGALQSAGRLTVSQMGLAATVEMLALGGVSAALAAWLRHHRLRSWLLIGCLAVAAANVLGLFAGGIAFIATRGAAGVGGGIILWVATGVVTRRIDAPRVNAIFQGAQAVAQGISAALIPIFLGPRLGANASLVVLGGMAAVVMPLIAFIPSELPLRHTDSMDRPAFHASSYLGLGASFLIMAGIVGVWVFVEPIAATAGIAVTTVSAAIAASLGTQVIGALLIASTITLVAPSIGVIAMALLYMIVIGVLAWGHSSTAFVVVILLFGALWTVTMSLLLPFMIKLDPTRRAAMLLPGAILLGSSAGPAIAGTVATDTNIGPALLACAAMFALATVCAGVALAVSIRGSNRNLTARAVN